jgi:5'-nucleotidase/UDP-sugar diphosphatase
MVMRRLAPVLVILALFSAGCASATPAPRVAVQPTLTILHFNDVYEIDALSNGRLGGLARVATVIDNLKHTSSRVLTTLSGDYLAPSAMGTARVNGVALEGRQMVSVLNAIGLDWATFGNHEFDVSEAAFRKHLGDAGFRLVSSNVTDANGKPFPGVVESTILTLKISKREIRLGLIGLTVDSTVKPWVRYTPPIDAAKTQVAKLAGKVDAIVALTHLSLAGDRELAIAVPEIDLILGGHEHENWMMRRGDHLTPVIKADANVRTVAIVTMAFGAAGSRPVIEARLESIDDHITPKPEVQAEVERWTALAFDAFRKDGFFPEHVVATAIEALDGREASVRNGSTRLTQIVASAVAHDVKGADVSIFNSGAIRIDDVLPPGPIREYDIIRVLPFGGKTLKATFDGALLAQVLDAGLKNAGNGGYLQSWGTSRDAGGKWLVQGKPLDPSARYTVAIADYLLTGGETNLGFLTRTNPGVHDVSDARDVRQAVIDELKLQFPVR